MKKEQHNHLKKIKSATIMSMMLFTLTACGKLSADEAANRLGDIGSDMISGERTVHINEDKREAYNAAKKYIESQLDSPTSAKYSECVEDDIVQEYSEDKGTYYTLTIDVDSKNVFGTMIKNTFALEVSGYPDFEVTEISLNGTPSNMQSNDIEESTDVGNEESNSTQNNEVQPAVVEQEAKQSTNDYVIPDSDSRYLTDADLDGLSKEELRIARNEISARKGRKFKDSELSNYFKSKAWYNPTIEPDDFSSDHLNKYEIYNQSFILKAEKNSESGAAKDNSTSLLEKYWYGEWKSDEGDSFTIDSTSNGGYDRDVLSVTDNGNGITVEYILYQEDGDYKYMDQIDDNEYMMSYMYSLQSGGYSGGTEYYKVN